MGRKGRCKACLLCDPELHCSRKRLLHNILHNVRIPHTAPGKDLRLLRAALKSSKEELRLLREGAVAGTFSPTRVKLTWDFSFKSWHLKRLKFNSTRLALDLSPETTSATNYSAKAFNLSFFLKRQTSFFKKNVSLFFLVLFHILKLSVVDLSSLGAAIQCCAFCSSSSACSPFWSATRASSLYKWANFLATSDLKSFCRKVYLIINILSFSSLLVSLCISQLLFWRISCPIGGLNKVWPP